jgi:hypothetical protein
MVQTNPFYKSALARKENGNLIRLKSKSKILKQTIAKAYKKVECFKQQQYTD